MKNLFSIILFLISVSLSAQTNNAIFEAIDNEDIKALTISVNRNNVNSFNSKGETPLTYLLKKNEYNNTLNQFLEILFKNKADPNLPNKNGMPPLHLAGDNYKLCFYLLKQGADINIKNSYGNTMLYDLLVYTEIYGGFEKYFGDIDFFIKNGGNINSLNNYGESVLISMLSRVMAMPVYKDNNGKERGGYLSHDFSPLIEYLVKKGSKINIITRSGETALSISRKTNANQDQIDTLIKLGAVK